MEDASGTELAAAKPHVAMPLATLHGRDEGSAPPVAEDLRIRWLMSINFLVQEAAHAQPSSVAPSKTQKTVQARGKHAGKLLNEALHRFIRVRAACPALLAEASPAPRIFSPSLARPVSCIDKVSDTVNGVNEPRRPRPPFSQKTRHCGSRSQLPPLTGSEDPQMDSPEGKRASRPAYNEQQKFFIAYMRIVRQKSWAQIGEDYAICFPEDGTPRSKGGLTSVYYRLRKEWGLPDVNDIVTETSFIDHWSVHIRALNFTQETLESMGYVEPPAGDSFWNDCFWRAWGDRDESHEITRMALSNDTGTGLMML